jgi:hypothetical protein
VFFEPYLAVPNGGLYPLPVKITNKVDALVGSGMSASDVSGGPGEGCLREAQEGPHCDGPSTYIGGMWARGGGRIEDVAEGDIGCFLRLWFLCCRPHTAAVVSCSMTVPA